MAELSYDDVKRAAQDAVRELHDTLGGLRSASDDIRRNTQHTNNTHNQLTDLNNRINNLQTQLSGLISSLQKNQNTVYLLQNIQQKVDEVHARLGGTEEFLRGVHTYLTAQAEREAQREEQ